MDEEEKIRIVREGYDRIAPLYHADRLSFDNTGLLDRFINSVKPKGHILDAGCGAGVPFAKTLVENGFRVTGIDISESMLGLARKNVPSARFLKQDMTKLSFEDCMFEGVTSTYALIHVPKALHSRVYKHFYRILKPGGVLLVSTGRDEWEEAHDFYGALMFWSHHGKDTSLELITSAGFNLIWHDVVETRGERHYWILAKKE